MSEFIGLYIHIPFCRSKCPYCDFFSVRTKQYDYENYVNILINSIEKWSKKINKKVDTIYFGGGTPSLIGAPLIYKVLTNIKMNFEVTKDCEITIEVNPSSGNFFDFDLVKKAGVNRVSIGLQSADQQELKLLGRIHSLEDVSNTIKLCRKSNINNISLDLMIGIPNQTKESLKKSIDFCIDNKVQHISSYILCIEKNTYFYKNKEKYIFPDEDVTFDLYLFLTEYLNDNGFKQYEISNFSLTGYESKHNTKYWNLDNYLGIGPSAHSFLDNKRFYYSRSFEDFENDIIIDDGVGGNEEEYIMLKLRLTSGLNVSEYKKAFGKELSKDFFSKVDKFVKLNLMSFENDNICFTTNGFLLSNSILSELI